MRSSFLLFLSTQKRTQTPSLQGIVALSVREGLKYQDTTRRGQASVQGLQAGNILPNPHYTVTNNFVTTIYFPGDGKDILMSKTRKISARDDVNVMPKLSKGRYKSAVGALVEEAFHRVASERAPSVARDSTQESY